MHTNRLIEEKSPYLIQHAHNPVDWYPWGEEAFRKAREEAKPIFLSVGYSTCHWCHVMERESFEDEALSEMLNRYFVPIKVDREERPDVDRVYMLFVQATTGSGGWPMSVFLTPELKPFFGGTYFPPEPRYGHPGFRQVLERVAEAWQSDKEGILTGSSDIVAQLGRQAAMAPAAAPLDTAVFESGYFAFRRSFDREHGGFGGAPKFPRPSVLSFLIRYHHRTNEPEALDMVTATLEAMARGGINDHLGGGFHRYSVDERWFVPHFEKMLYDQAQLAIAYVEALQVSGNAWYGKVARSIFEYVLRDMTNPEGGFYSAEDADSAPDPAAPEKKAEGAFYTWTAEELRTVLGSDADAFCRHYGVEEIGNVTNDPHAEFAGRNILFEARPDDSAPFADARRRLLEARSKRPRPHLDDKILTSWNGLMISAFARGAQASGEPRYLQAASRAADFVLGRLYRREDGMLLRRYRDGHAAIPAFLDDYAFLVQGLLDLYEAGFDVRRLEDAILLTDRQIELFDDSASGGFFSTAAGEGDVVLRLKDDYDGAEPSGNSVAILNLLRLSQITARQDHRDTAERAMRALGSRAATVPQAVPQLLVALEFAAAKPRQIVLAGPREDARMQALIRTMHGRFLPDKIALMVDGADARRVLERYQPSIGSMADAAGDRPTAHVCENFTCHLPVTDPEAFASQLG
jgi:uncharacterized protein YyaL (SSP411 family)